MRIQTRTRRLRGRGGSGTVSCIGKDPGEMRPHRQLPGARGLGQGKEGPDLVLVNRGVSVG